MFGKITVRVWNDYFVFGWMCFLLQHDSFWMSLSTTHLWRSFGGCCVTSTNMTVSLVFTSHWEEALTKNAILNNTSAAGNLAKIKMSVYPLLFSSLTMFENETWVINLYIIWLCVHKRSNTKSTCFKRNLCLTNSDCKRLAPS